MASKTVRARLDSESERALEILTARGRSESEAVRDALVQAAAALRRATLQIELQRLADDPNDTQERHAVMADMEALGPSRTG